MSADQDEAFRVAVSSDDHAGYLEEFAARLRKEGIRAEVDHYTDRMQKKIRTAQQQKIPFMVIAGGDDVAAGTVSFRYRDGSQRNGVPVEEAVEQVVAWIASRTNADPSAADEQDATVVAG